MSRCFLEARPAVADGTLYLAGRDRVLWAVDAATAQRLWKQRLRPRRPRFYDQYTDPAADGQVYVSFPGDSLYTVDAATGRRLWEVETHASPVVADGTPCVGGDRGLIALDAASETLTQLNVRQSARSTGVRPGEAYSNG